MDHRRLALCLTLAGLLAGCGSTTSDNFVQAPANQVATRDSALPQVVRAPKAFADTVLLEGEEVVTHPLLANDSVNGATVVSYDPQGTAGGTISITPDGILTYTPPTLLAQTQPTTDPQPITDRFSYTLANSAGQATATVVARRGRNIYLNANSKGGGNGSIYSPYTNLQNAMSSMGSGPATLWVGPGRYEGPSQDTVYTLSPGQYICSLEEDQPSPEIVASFQVAGKDCGLRGLTLVGGSGGRALITLADASLGQVTLQPPFLSLANLTLKNHQAPGILLFLAGVTEMTNIKLDHVNMASGQGGIVLQNMVGSVKVSQLDAEYVPVAGVYCSTSSDLSGGQPISLDIDGYFTKGVDFPIVYEASTGTRALELQNYSCGWPPPTVRDLSAAVDTPDAIHGTFLTGNIAGDAKVDARVERVDTDTFGPVATFMK